jgi:hypothetical protein
MECLSPTILLVLTLGAAVFAEATSNNRSFGERTVPIDMSTYDRFTITKGND